MDFANILKLQGFSQLYLAELNFIKQEGCVAANIDDTIEMYTALTRGALYEKYDLGPDELARHWDIALCTIEDRSKLSSFYHPDADIVAARYIRDTMIHDRNIDVPDLPLEQLSFADAFRTARAAGVSYFAVCSLDENERDIVVKLDLYEGATGRPVRNFSVYRSGADRLRNAARALSRNLNAALPFRAVVIRLSGGEALVDKGRADGLAALPAGEPAGNAAPAAGAAPAANTAAKAYDVVKKGTSSVDGLSLRYLPGNVVAEWTPSVIEEEFSLGVLKRRGFFDRIAVGDEIILSAPDAPLGGRQGAASVASPELQALLRDLR
jgi:hypothetical protein